jgi:hypothetical protein
MRARGVAVRGEQVVDALLADWSGEESAAPK